MSYKYACSGPWPFWLKGQGGPSLQNRKLPSLRIPERLALGAVPAVRRRPCAVRGSGAVFLVGGLGVFAGQPLAVAGA